MKKGKKIALFILLAIIFVVGVIAYSQRENIKAIYFGFTEKPEDIEIKLEENKEKSDSLLSDITDTKMQSLTDEERKKLESGELDAEEAIAIITGQKADEPSSPSKIPEDSKPSASAEIDKAVARIYLLKAEYLNVIDGLIAEAKSEYRSIPKKELTFSKKIELAKKYMNKASSLEEQCDQKMEEHISALERLLEANGKDTAIIDEIRTTYKNEKQLKKSELVRRYSPN